MPGSGKFVIYLIQDVARCTLPYHQSRRQRRTDVMSSMPSFCSGEAVGVLSLHLVPQVQRIMARSRWQSRCSSVSFGHYVSLPWSIAEWMQASYTLPHTLGERCLVVRTGKSFLNFPAGHIASGSWSAAYHPGSKTWLPHQAWCHRHPLQSQFGHRWAENRPYTWGRYSLGHRPIT